MGFSFASVQLRITQNEAVVARSSRCCLSWQSLRPKPAQSPITMDTMDILLTVDTTDGVDITDIPTDTGNVIPKLHPLPLLLPPPMLMPAPNLGTMDTTDIPTDGAVTTEDITDTDTLTDTGGRDLLNNNNQNLNILSNDPLMLTLMPMPAPNPGTMDTTAIPTHGAVTTEDITDTVILYGPERLWSGHGLQLPLPACPC